jgi:cell wall-associated NlpC family hydrolase
MAFGMYYMRWEGYHWGGGCANDNNVDDQPGEPLQKEWTHGEGTDCSGFVRKAWGIRSANTTEFGTYAPLQYTHGPYTATSYRSSTTAWKSIPNGNVGFWDGFASTSHIGLVWSTGSNGSDLVFESKSEADGSGIWNRTYRSSSSYKGVLRLGWA